VSEMIERVARALFDASQLRLSSTLTNEVLYGRSDVTWELLNSSEVIPGIIESYRKQARAAIEAMREPSVEMCSAGEDSGFLHWSPEEGEGLDEVDMAAAYRAMIDAALDNGK
jgi:hypothetical protein